LLFTGKWEAYPEGGARINGIDKCATSDPSWVSCHAKVAMVARDASRTKLIAVGEPFNRLEFDACRVDNE
jgi:hypothetical protein